MTKPIATAAASALALALTAAAGATSARQQFSVVAHSYSSKRTGKTETFKEHLSIAGKRIGHDMVTCTPHGKRMLCHGVMYLPKGQIRVRVIAGGGPNTSGTITGGTRAYTGARGTITLHGLPRNRDRITFVID